MQKVEYFPFAFRSVGRAIALSASYFGLDVKTAITGVVLVVLGWGLYAAVKGADALRNQALDWLLLTTMPSVIFLAALLLFNLFRAPYLIYLEEYQKSVDAIALAASARTKAENENDELREALAMARQQYEDSLANHKKANADLSAQLSARQTAVATGPRRLDGPECQQLAAHIQALDQAARRVASEKFSDDSRRHLSTTTNEIRQWLATTVGAVAAQSFFSAPPSGSAYSGMSIQFGGLWQGAQGRLAALREIASRVCN